MSQGTALKKAPSSELIDKLNLIDKLAEQMKEAVWDAQYTVNGDNNNVNEHRIYECSACSTVYVPLPEGDPALAMGSNCPRCIIDTMNSAADCALWHITQGEFMKGIHTLMGMVVCEWTELDNDGGSCKRGKEAFSDHRYLFFDEETSPLVRAFFEEVHGLSKNLRKKVLASDGYTPEEIASFEEGS